VLIVGGTSGEVASSEVYRLDTQSGALTTIAHLPSPLTHAAAVAVGQSMLVLGGRVSPSSGQTRSILAITPAGSVRTVGMLPTGLSDMAAALLGSRVILAGGRDQNGRVRDQIMTLGLTGG
jgi:N-acetylneuraminic acid mutarotase